MNRIHRSLLITGMKHCGKSSTARMLSKHFSTAFVDIDTEAEALYKADTGENFTSREIYLKGGPALFKDLERRASEQLSKQASAGRLIAAAGGGICDNDAAVDSLKRSFVFIYIREDARILYDRIIRGGIPAFLSPEDPYNDFLALYKTRTAKYDMISDICIDAAGRSASAVSEDLIRILREGEYAG